MTPEQSRKLNEVYDFMKNLQASSSIPLLVDRAFRKRLENLITLPDGFEDAPLTAITAPSGGATIDSQARTAINTIISTLESLGLVLPN